MSRRTLWALVALLAITPLVYGDTELQTAAAAYETVGREQVFDGVVEAVNQTTVSAQTTGRVVEVTCDVDDFVGKGDVLVRLRGTQQRANLEKAEAALREAQVRYEQATAEYARISKVFEKELVSKTQFDKARAEKDAARARLEAAQAELHRAAEELERTRIRAPYSGIVTKRFVEVGETAQPGEPVMSGVSLERLRVKTPVPQRLINPIRKLRKARVLMETGDGMVSIPAANLTFFPYAAGRSNTFDVRVELPENTADLFPGMFVKVAFVTGERRQLVIPAQAVVQRSEVTGVYVVGAQGRITFRHIRPGRSAPDGKIEVLAGLQEGEDVALDPIRAGELLKSGSGPGASHGG